MKTFFAVAVMAALSLSNAGVAAFAQDSKFSLTLRFDAAADSGRATQESRIPMPPPICKPCLFYGGDVYQNDPNSAAFADEDTLLVSDTSTYGSVIIPAGKSATIEGLFFQMSSGDAEFDAKTASYDIREGVSEGNGGTSLASGSGPAHVALYGRGQFPDYTVAVAVNPPLTLGAGQYWFNVTPQCTNSGDSNCSSIAFFVYNTTQETNNVRGNAQPAGQIFFNSTFFGYNWANWCDPQLGQNAQACARLSFGIIGK